MVLDGLMLLLSHYWDDQNKMAQLEIELFFALNSVLCLQCKATFAPGKVFKAVRSKTRA